MKDFKHLEEKLEKQRQLAIQLKAIKDAEAKLRREICDELLKGRHTGTHNFDICGMKVKAVKSVSMRIDSKIDVDSLTDEEKALIAWKPSLKIGDYKKTTSDTSNLDEFIVVTPSMPTLTIELAPEI